ncbi:MAG TPA: hypothetical protein PK090_02890 [Smithellaceae bacterium]|nr:hypothetical protein [Smithellaceae bacterium]
MTITPYHLDSVLNAYTRQSKVKVSSFVQSEMKREGTLKDVVSLSSTEDAQRLQEMDAISYTLRDFLLKDRNV